MTYSYIFFNDLKQYIYFVNTHYNSMNFIFLSLQLNTSNTLSIKLLAWNLYSVWLLQAWLWM